MILREIGGIDFLKQLRANVDVDLQKSIDSILENLFHLSENVVDSIPCTTYKYTGVLIKTQGSVGFSQFFFLFVRFFDDEANRTFRFGQLPRTVNELRLRE